MRSFPLWWVVLWVILLPKEGRSAGRLCQCTAYLSLMSMSKRPHVSVTFLVSFARPDWSIFGEKQNYLPPPNPPNGSSLLKVTQFGSDFLNFSLFASWRSRDTPTSWTLLIFGTLAPIFCSKNLLQESLTAKCLLIMHYSWDWICRKAGHTYWQKNKKIMHMKIPT